jgi:hypothetical protein
MVHVPQNDHEHCYGTMFPSVLSVESGRIVSGTVFSFEIVRAGGTFVSDRKVSVNRQEWDNCVDCPKFEPCYKLSMGKLAMESAIAG